MDVPQPYSYFTCVILEGSAMVATGITVSRNVTPSDEHSSVRCLEQTVSSETSVHLYQTLQRHISEYHAFVFCLF